MLPPPLRRRSASPFTHSRGSIAWPSRSLSTLRGSGRPRTTQDSLPAGGQPLPHRTLTCWVHYGRFPRIPTSSLPPPPGFAWRNSEMRRVTTTAPPRAGSSHIRGARGERGTGRYPAIPRAGPVPGACRRLSALAAPVARPWPKRDRLDSLIQLRCLTNPGLAPCRQRNAGWIKGMQVRPRCYPCYLFS